MPSEAGGPSLELRRTITAPPDSLGRQRSHFLKVSADITQDPLTGSSRSVPSVALPYQLLITVSATGELTISELSTSQQKHGSELLMNHYPEDSSESQFQQQNKPLESRDSASQILPYPGSRRLSENPS